ncbi:mediator of RNA polymerase II transcription subunit 14, putative [Plasmodium vivax]|nr:mediator of RNA polymerase II transcription subunit 14, putative [Plasmodium vivax]
MMTLGGKDGPDGPEGPHEPEPREPTDGPDSYDHRDHREGYDGHDHYDDFKGISYGMMLKKVLRRSINDWSLFCERVDNDSGENADYLRSALIQYCRHMRECFLKLLEVNAFRRNYKEINETIKLILEYRESYRELKSKYQYELYLCKVKMMDLQINESNVLCAVDLLSTGRYTRFPLLFKGIISNPSDSFIPNLNVNQINILKKRIVDEFLINYYTSRIPKDKVNFSFSDGFIELDVVSEVKVSLITDFVTWSVVKADIFFLRHMNLHSSHNLNLISLVSYGVVQKMGQMAGEQKGGASTAPQMDMSHTDMPRLEMPHADIPHLDCPTEASDAESSQSGDFLLNRGSSHHSERHVRIEQMRHARVNPIEQHYHREREKRTQAEETLPLADVLYEIYKISHFYCSVQIMEFFKGSINQHNTFNYPSKKSLIYKCFSNGTVEVTPSCYNYSLSDKDALLHLDIHLYECALGKGMYEWFKKIPLLDQHSKKKMILKFVLNNENGNIGVFLWPFSFFKKGKKESFPTDDILTSYEFSYCAALQRRMKRLFSFDPAHIHLESWFTRVANCVTRFLFSILKAFSSPGGDPLHGVASMDHTRSSETSFGNNAIGVHELVQDYFFDLGYIRGELLCEGGVGSVFEGVGENHPGGANHVEGAPLRNRIQTVLMKKQNGDSCLLTYTFYGQKINLFLNRQSEKFTFMCHWKSKTFIDTISLHYDLKLVIYVVYLLKRFSLYVYVYNELQERFLAVNAGRVFNYELAKDQFCPQFFFHKLKLHDLLKKYNYSANILLTKFLQSFFSLIDFYFYLPCGEGGATKGGGFESALRKLVHKGGEAAAGLPPPQGSAHLGGSPPREENLIGSFEGTNLGESPFSTPAPQRQPGGSGYEETPEEGKKAAPSRDPFRQNFISVLYFTIYTYDRTPLLLILLIEKDCIHQTYIVICENDGVTSGADKERSEQGKTSKRHLFTIPLIHRSYPLGNHLEDYLDGLRDMVNRFSNLFSTLGKLLRMNSRCPVFCSPFGGAPSRGVALSGGALQHDGTAQGGDAPPGGNAPPGGKPTLKAASNQTYARLRKEKKKSFLDLQYFVSKSQSKRAPPRESADVCLGEANLADSSKEKYPADYITNYLLHLECELDAEHYMSRELLSNHEGGEFPLLIKVNTYGSFFFEVPFRQRKLLKIRDSNLKKSSEISFLCCNVAVNVKIDPLEVEGADAPSVHWVRMKKMYLLLKDESSPRSILHLFAVLSKIFSALNFFPELYYLERMMSPDVSIRNCHLANITVEYHCGVNRQIACSLTLDVLNGGEVPPGQLDDPPGRGLNKERFPNRPGEGDPNGMATNRRIKQTSDEEDELEKLLSFDVSFNSPFECINELFSREKKKLSLYLKKKKSIFSLLKFLLLTFEFHYNFYIVINKTSEHLRKVPFLHPVDLLHDVQFDCVNLLTVLLTLKCFSNDKGVLSFYFILHPENFSKVVIIPHYRGTHMGRHQREVSIKNFFRRGKRSHSGERHADEHTDQHTDQRGAPPKTGPGTPPNDAATVEGTPPNAQERGIRIDHLDEEDLFIYLFSHFCDVINLKRVNQSAIYSPGGDLHSDQVSPSRGSSHPLEGAEDPSLGESAIENDLKIFEEYDLFILNIKYLFKMKNQIVLSEVFFFPPFFLYTTLYPFVEFLKTLKCWLVLLGQLRVHHSDITLMCSEIGDVFQHVTAVRRRGAPPGEGKNANVNANVSANVSASVSENVSANVSADVSADVSANVSANVNADVNANVCANVNAEVSPNVSADVNAEVSATVQSAHSEHSGAPPEGHPSGHRQDDEIVVHLVWFLYSTKDLYVDAASLGEGKTCKRSYAALLGDPGEVNQEDSPERGGGGNGGGDKGGHGFGDHDDGHHDSGYHDDEHHDDRSEHKKVKRQEEDGQHSEKGHLRGDDPPLSEAKSEEMQNVKWETGGANPVAKKWAHTTNHLSTPFQRNETNTEKLKHMINAYSHSNDDIFLKKKAQKIWLGGNFIRKAYALRVLEPRHGDPPSEEGKRGDPRGEEGKNGNIGERTGDHRQNDFPVKINPHQATPNRSEPQNDGENMFFFNEEKMLIGGMKNAKSLAWSGENVYKGDMHYWINSVGIFFENVGETVDEGDSWFYRNRGRVPTREGTPNNNNEVKTRTRKFIMEEQNVLKEISKINSALNIIYSYVRTWLLKMNHSSVISFFRIISEIVVEKKNICELSAFLFNSVLSYREYLAFWMFPNREGVSMPFVEMEFVPEGEDHLVAAAGGKKGTSFFRNKWVELVVPVEEAVHGGYLMDGEVAHAGGDSAAPSTSRGNKIIPTGGGNDGKRGNCHPNPATEKAINIKYKIWRYMPPPFKKKMNEQEVTDIMGGANESVTLTFKISSVLPVKNLKEVYINDEPFVKFLVKHKIDLNVAHERVMAILEKHNLMANYSLVATQTILHRSSFERLLKGGDNDSG